MAVVYPASPEPPKNNALTFAEHHVVLTSIVFIALGIGLAWLISKVRSSGGTSTSTDQTPQTLYVPTSNTFETINNITGTSGNPPGGTLPPQAGPGNAQPAPGSATAPGAPAGGTLGERLPPEAGPVGAPPEGTLPPEPSPGGVPADRLPPQPFDFINGIIPPEGTLPPEGGPSGTLPIQPGTIPPGVSPGNPSAPAGRLPPEGLGSGGTLALLRARTSNDRLPMVPIRSRPDRRAPPVGYHPYGGTVSVGHPAPHNGFYAVSHLGTSGWMDALDVVGLTS